MWAKDFFSFDQVSSDESNLENYRKTEWREKHQWIKWIIDLPNQNNCCCCYLLMQWIECVAILFHCCYYLLAIIVVIWLIKSFSRKIVNIVVFNDVSPFMLLVRLLLSLPFLATIVPKINDAKRDHRKQKRSFSMLYICKYTHTYVHSA